MKTKFLKLRYLRQMLGDLERSQGVAGGGGALLSSQKQACQMFFSADRCGWGSVGPERVFLGHSHSPTERTVLGPWVPGRCVSNSMKTRRHPAPRRERGQRDGGGGVLGRTQNSPDGLRGQKSRICIVFGITNIEFLLCGFK